MKKINRREFVAHTAASAVVAGVAAGRAAKATTSRPSAPRPPVEQVALGKTGIKLSRVGIGTGTHGYNQESDQTRLGFAKCVDLLLHAYARGITYFDLADLYGSHRHVREALKKIPRDRVTLLTKCWKPTAESVSADIERFRKELDTDQIDIVLLHCQTDGDWPTKLADAMKVLAEAKRKGWVKAHGCSCHSLEALRSAAGSEWVDVDLARINHNGTNMDAKPDVVVPVLERMSRGGKGVLGMKIFGEGKFTKAEQRLKSLRFVLGQPCVHAFNIGFLSCEQIDDVLGQINEILGA